MRRAVFGALIAVVTMAGGLRAQDPAPADTAQVLPDDHPLRPQPPPRPDLSAGERFASAIGRLLKLPFEYTGTALEGTLIPLEEERGGFAAGLSATAARPAEPKRFSIGGGSLGTRSGFVGLGLQYRVFPERQGPQLGFTAAATNRGYQQHTAYVGWNDSRDHPYVRVTGYYDLDSMDEFWGLGPETDKEVQGIFSWDKYGVIAAAGVPEASGIVWGRAYFTYERTSIFRGREQNEPDVVDLFPAFVFPELELYGPGVTLALDLRDTRGYPRKGLLLQATGELWRSAGDEDLEWFRYAGEASGHVPLGSDWHILSLKAGFEHAKGVSGTGTQDIPFPYLPTLGGSQVLRGFGGWRFRDAATLYGTGEFRWRVWQEHTTDPERAAALETALFYDVGYLGDDPFEIDLGEDRKTAFGLLGRFYLVSGHLLTFGVGHSEEETRFVFSTNNSW